MSESESATCSEDYSEEENSFEFEPVDPNEEEGEGTRGLGDILAMVGIGGAKGSPAAPLLDVNGNPIEAVYTDDGQVVAPRIVDEEGNVIHDGPEPKKEGMGTGTKLAIGGAVVGGAALASVAALAAGGVATGVGVHYYRKKQKGGDKKGKKGKKGKKDKDGKKDKKDKKDKDGKKDKKDKDGKKDKKDKDKKKDKDGKKDKKDKDKKKDKKKK